MNNFNKGLKERYINSLKEAGQILTEQAEMLMNDVDVNKISDFTVWINFSPDEAVTMQIDKEYCVEHCYNAKGQRILQ